MRLQRHLCRSDFIRRVTNERVIVAVQGSLATAYAAPFANTPSASTVYLDDPHVSYVTGVAAANPFFAQGSTTLSETYKAPAVAQFSLGVQDQVAQSVILVYAIRWQHGVAPEHPPPDQQFPLEYVKHHSR